MFGFSHSSFFIWLTVFLSNIFKAKKFIPWREHDMVATVKVLENFKILKLVLKSCSMKLDSYVGFKNLPNSEIGFGILKPKINDEKNWNLLLNFTKFSLFNLLKWLCFRSKMSKIFIISIENFKILAKFQLKFSHNSFTIWLKFS